MEGHSPMGDILSSIFGGGQQQAQQTSVDRTTGNLNALRAQQLQGLFDQSPLWTFAQPTPALYTPTEADQQLLQTGLRSFGQQAPLTLDQYLNYAPGRDLLTAGTAYGSNLTDSAIADLQQGTQGALANLATGVSGAEGQVENAYQRAAGLSNERLQQALALGGTGIQSFLRSVATPQIMQQAALQGLEGGAAVPEALARAAAEQAMPFLSSTLGQYGQEQTGFSQSDLQALQALEGLGISTGAGLQGQAAQTQAQLRGQQLGQGTGLFQSFIPTEASFAQSLPQAAALSMSVPAQAALTTSQAASTLFPMADYSRNLGAEDYTRRQGLATTGLTGIPYTPQTSTTGSTTQKPLFNFFGMG